MMMMMMMMTTTTTTTTTTMMMMSILTFASAFCSFYSYTPHFPSPSLSFLISLYPNCDYSGNFNFINASNQGTSSVANIQQVTSIIQTSGVDPLSYAIHAGKLQDHISDNNGELYRLQYMANSEDNCIGKCKQHGSWTTMTTMTRTVRREF